MLGRSFHISYFIFHQSYIILHIPSIIYDHISSYITYIIIYHQLSSYIISSYIVMYHHISSYIVMYHHISSYTFFIIYHIWYIICYIIGRIFDCVTLHCTSRLHDKLPLPLPYEYSMIIMVHHFSIFILSSLAIYFGLDWCHVVTMTDAAFMSYEGQW